MTDREIDLPPPTLERSYYCNKCGHMGPVGELHPLPNGSGLCNYYAVSNGPYWNEEAVRAAVLADRAEREGPTLPGPEGPTIPADEGPDDDQRKGGPPEVTRAMLLAAEGIFRKNGVEFSPCLAGEVWRAMQAARAAAPSLRPFKVLRAAVDAMMAPLGYHGTISARDDRVQSVMDALHQIDEIEK